MPIQRKYVSNTVNQNRLKQNSPIALTSEVTSSEVGSFQKVLLRANGTVTAMLEAYLSEQIEIVKLSEKVELVNVDFPKISFDRKQKVIARKVLLQGATSYQNFIYAESLILLENLEKQFSEALLNTKIPIGKLWSEQKVETFKEIMFSGLEPARELASYFCITPEEHLFSRTYSVSSRGKVTMIITEKFPEKGFFSLPIAA